MSVGWWVYGSVWLMKFRSQVHTQKRARWTPARHEFTWGNLLLSNLGRCNLSRKMDRLWNHGFWSLMSELAISREFDDNSEPIFYWVFVAHCPPGPVFFTVSTSSWITHQPLSKRSQQTNNSSKLPDLELGIYANLISPTHVTLPKTNMEPKNEDLEDDSPFQRGDFQVPC